MLKSRKLSEDYYDFDRKSIDRAVDIISGLFSQASPAWESISAPMSEDNSEMISITCVYPKDVEHGDPDSIKEFVIRDSSGKIMSGAHAKTLSGIVQTLYTYVNQSIIPINVSLPIKVIVPTSLNGMGLKGESADLIKENRRKSKKGEKDLQLVRAASNIKHYSVGQPLNAYDEFAVEVRNKALGPTNNSIGFLTNSKLKVAIARAIVAHKKYEAEIIQVPMDGYQRYKDWDNKQKTSFIKPDSTVKIFLEFKQ